MLGYFPPLLPDEMLYSAFARYADRMPDSSKSLIASELFGIANKRAKINLDFPSHLNEFYSRLPLGMREFLTVDNLIDEHTLYRFVSVFKEPESCIALRTAMRSGSLTSAYASRLPGASATSDYLRYCPHCIREDLELHGEPYWRRAHQIGCVYVCLSHEVQLEASSIKRATLSYLDFVSARQVLQLEVQPVKVDLGFPATQVLLWLARTVRWLLDHPIVSSTSDGFAREYAFHLNSMGLATFNGIIKLAALKRRFTAFYSPELLSMLNVKPADIWVRRVATGESSSPVENLLMWHFLGLTAEEFTLSIGRTSFFEPGPWPCLNPTCSHYGKNAIQTFKQRVDERGQLFGLFSCSCGFIYSRQGPDMTGERRVELHKIVETGPIWQDALRQWWFDETLTIDAICKRFHTYEYTVHRVATNLGLPRNRPGQSELAQPPEIFKLERAEKKQQLIATYRIKLIEFVKANPEVSRSALQRVHLVTACANLMKFDRKWFEAHAPKRKNALHRVSKTRVDFENLDEKTYAMVAIARGALLMRTGAPTRISRQSLCKELGYKNGFHSSISKLKKTNKALNQASESLFDVALRRLGWIITQTKGQAIKPKNLLHRASVRKAWLDEPKTRKAIFTVMSKYYDSIELIVL